MSTVYQRVCLNPALERELAEFSREKGSDLRTMAELEADLFALDWSLPRWWFADGGRPDLPEELTVDGRRYLLLRRAFGSSPQLSKQAVGGLNRAGEEERERSEANLPAGGTQWTRAAWLLWNRERFEGSLSRELMDEYNRIIGGGGRYVPELREPVVGGGESESAPAWLPRVTPDSAAATVDGMHWAPLLLPPEGPGYPEYNIPIRPLPSREVRDSRVPWSHMFKPPTQRSLTLQAWIERARAQGAGLLLFPRSPAERALDSMGVPRS